MDDVVKAGILMKDYRAMCLGSAETKPFTCLERLPDAIC